MSKSLVATINTRISAKKAEMEKEEAEKLAKDKDLLLERLDTELCNCLQKLQEFQGFNISYSDLHAFFYFARAVSELGLQAIGDSDHVNDTEFTCYYISIPSYEIGTKGGRSVAQKRLYGFNASLKKEKAKSKEKLLGVCLALKKLMEDGEFTINDKASTENTLIYIYYQYCARDLIIFEEEIVRNFFKKFKITLCLYEGDRGVWKFAIPKT